MSGFKNRIGSPVSLLVIGSIVLRLIVYLMLPVSDDFGKYANASPLYFSAMTEHFGDYLSFSTNIPPATSIIDASILAVTGAKAAMSMRAFLIFVFILDVMAVVMLFNSAKRLGSPANISFLVMALFSVALIPFELWRDGMHYDHLTLFFTSFFVWSLVKLIKKENSFGNQLLVSFTGALLVSQSAANSAIVPFCVLVILCFLYLPKKRFFKLIYALFISLLLPVIVLIIISKKNQGEGQEGLTSNKAGPAMMMVVQRAWQFDASKIRSFAQENGAPGWYIWTYNHATTPIDSTTGKQAENWINLAQAFGICFYSADGKVKNNPWLFDFDPLLQYLQKNGPAELLSIVRSDAYDAMYRPYRFAGFAPELSPRWIGVYGDVSKKLFFTAVKKNPLRMGRAFIVQQGIFGMYGPLFLYNTTQSTQSLLARSGLRTMQSKLPLQFLLVPATLLFALVSALAYLVVFLNIPVTLWRMLRNARLHQKPATIHQFMLLSIPVLCIAAVYSCLVGGENDRYFLQAAPYLVVIATCLPVWFSRKPVKR